MLNQKYWGNTAKTHYYSSSEHRLEAKLGPYAACETSGGQFDDRGHSREVSYSGSSEDNDFRDDRTQKAEKIGVTQQNSAHKGHVEMQHFHTS